MRHHAPAHGKLGFTITEILVVIGVIALLVAVLLPALTGVLRTGDMTKSMNNMKQIALWMRSYSSENRETIVPSQFNYANSVASGYPVKVRSHAALGPLQYMGTWSDIIWTQNGLGNQSVIIDPAVPADVDKYYFDSPDQPIFEADPDYENPLRSAAPNTTHFGAPGSSPKPFGPGAAEAGLPGYFAANNFFRQKGPLPGDPEFWWTTGQIRVPERSMYLVDSFAGETIDPIPAPYDNVTTPKTIEVDFRYSGVCLMLMLDGHVDKPQDAWTDLPDLQGQRRVKVQNLDSN
jgi:type II secretory pathway pseudopilin PulG